MLALVEITPWHWVGFILGVFLFLALDLGVFHREARVVTFKEALGWTLIWVTLSLLFAAMLIPLRGEAEALEFFTGYVIELSLSMDNVFVIALIFAYFRVAPAHQHRVLFWGILGALVMRGLMIWLGVELINRFDWVLLVLGAFLVLSGVRMLFSNDEEVDPERNPVIRAARNLFPITPGFEGQRFFVRQEGCRMLTPLFLVLLMVETTDLVFALDSVPAIFGVTRKPFIVFTSNVFAILGLRSLYFVLAGMISLFRYLKTGLSVVLIFIGVKMLIAPHGGEPRWFQAEIPIYVSLAVVVGIIATAILASIITARSEAGARKQPP